MLGLGRLNLFWTERTDEVRKAEEQCGKKKTVEELQEEANKKFRQEIKNKNLNGKAVA